MSRSSFEAPRGGQIVAAGGGMTSRWARGAAVAWLIAIACSGYAVPDVTGRLTDDPGGPLAVDDRPVSVARVTDLGRLPAPPDLLARDGAVSGVFDGRSVWLFGDTFFRARGSGELGAVSNSYAWTGDLDASDGITFVDPTGPDGAPRMALPLSDEERAFNDAHAGPRCRESPCGSRWALWPQALLPDPGRHRLLVYYGKLFAEVELFHFTMVGQSIATWSSFDEGPVRPDDDHGMMLPDVTQPYGNAAVVVGDDAYVYGCTLGPGYSKPCRVARVPLVDALDPSAYRHYAGRGKWSSDPADAVAVLDANDVLSVAYNRHLSRYLAVYSPPLTNQVVFRTARRPEGPWSDPVIAFQTRTPTFLWVYDAQAHPEYEEDGGRIQYVTYSLASSETTSEFRLVQVELDGDSMALAVLGTAAAPRN